MTTDYNRILRKIFDASSNSPLITPGEKENLSRLLHHVDLIIANVRSNALLKKEVESNLEMLRIIDRKKSNQNRKNIIQILEKALLNKARSEEINKGNIIAALKKAASYIPRKQEAGDDSLMLRIAIHNIAKTAGIPTPLGKLEALSPASAVPATKKPFEVETIGYEIREFVLSKFGKDFDPTVFSDGFILDDLFKILEDMGAEMPFIANKEHYESGARIVEEKIVALLKATSMSDPKKHSDLEIQREAAQIRDLLYIYEVAKRQKTISLATPLSSLTNGSVEFSKFNTAIQRLKRSIVKESPHAARAEESHEAIESKESEGIQEINEQAKQTAQTIQATVKSYIQLRFGENAEKAVEKALAIIRDENKKRSPNIQDALERTRESILELGKGYYNDVPDLFDLLHIYIAAEKCQKYPSQYTRENLVFMVETVADTVPKIVRSEHVLPPYIRALQTILSQLSVNKEDEPYLRGAFDSLQRIREAKEKKKQQRLATEQIAPILSIIQPYLEEQKDISDDAPLPPDVLETVRKKRLLYLSFILSPVKLYCKEPNDKNLEEIIKLLDGCTIPLFIFDDGSEFGNPEGVYGNILKEILSTLLASKLPLTPDQKERLLASSKKLDSHIQDHQQKSRGIQILKEARVVESNLEMLKRAGISSKDTDENISTVIQKLEQIQAILSNEVRSKNDMDIIRAELKDAVNHVPQCKNLNKSLMLRIAIHNIARTMDYAIRFKEFGLKVQGATLPLSFSTARREQNLNPGTIVYEIRKFVLSKFGNEFNPDIFRENFTKKDLFNEILAHIGDLLPWISDKNYEQTANFLEARVIELLKVTSISHGTDAEIKREAAQILDLLYIYDILPKKQIFLNNDKKTRLTKESSLDDLNNHLVSLSPFNTAIQHLKRSAKQHCVPAHPSAAHAAAKEKEPEVIEEKAEQIAEMIKGETNKCIQLILGADENDPLFKRLLEIIRIENKKHSPDLKFALQEMVQAVDGKCQEDDVLKLRNLIHIYIAAEKYKEAAPDTLDNLFFTIENVANVLIISGTLPNGEKNLVYLTACKKILLKLQELSSLSETDKASLSNLSEQLEMLHEKQRQKEIEAREKEEQLREKLQLEEFVKSSLAMLKKARILDSRLEELQKIQAILDKARPDHNRENFKERIGEVLTRAAGYVTLTQHSDQSLMVRIAIHNIARTVGIATPPFGQLIGEAPSPAAAAPVEETLEPGTIGYEIRKFVLSKFGNHFNPAIFSEGFTENNLFEVLELMGEDKDSSEIMETRIIELLKATSMNDSGKHSDLEIKWEATQILDCLQVYHAATTQQKQNHLLADLTNKELKLSPFNPTLQRLKKYTAAPAAEEKEMEKAQEINGQAQQQIAEAIQASAKTYVKSILGADMNDALFNNLLRITLDESKKNSPKIAVIAQPISRETGKKYSKERPFLFDLLNIHNIADAYKKNPSQYTRENLVLIVEAAVSAVKESDELEYVKALQEILSQLSHNNVEDESYLRGASDKLKGFMEAVEKKKQQLLATKQVAPPEEEKSEAETPDDFSIDNFAGSTEPPMQAGMNRPQSSTPKWPSNVDIFTARRIAPPPQSNGGNALDADTVENIAYIEYAAKKYIESMDYCEDIFSVLAGGGQIPDVHGFRCSKAWFNSWVKPADSTHIKSLLDIYIAARKCWEPQADQTATQAQLLLMVKIAIKEANDERHPDTNSQHLKYFRALQDIMLLLQNSSPILLNDIEEKMALNSLSTQLKSKTNVAAERSSLQKLKQEAVGKKYVQQAKKERSKHVAPRHTKPPN